MVKEENSYDLLNRCKKCWTKLTSISYQVKLICTTDSAAPTSWLQLNTCFCKDQCVDIIATLFIVIKSRNHATVH